MKNKKKLLLNCDLGEWESLDQMAALIPQLHLANIACGNIKEHNIKEHRRPACVIHTKNPSQTQNPPSSNNPKIFNPSQAHAGSPEKIRHATEIAKTHHVQCGAHPGVSTNKGRSLPENFTPDDFTKLLTTQISNYLAATNLAYPQHLKLHGALYHLSEEDPKFRDILLYFVKKMDIPLICLAAGNVAREAAAQKIPHLQEAFLDRHYQPNGQLLPRSHPDALIHDKKPFSPASRPLHTGGTICRC